MTIQDVVTASDRKWTRAAPALSSAVELLEQSAGFSLPHDYVLFLALSNGGEGQLGLDPGWFALWAAEDVINLNREYGVPEFVPHYFGIGSNGGGEMLAFDVRLGVTSPVYMIPFVPMDESEAREVAPSFLEFCRHFGL